MPKQKTHRGAAKRFSLTKTGKVKHKKMNANHILNKKTTKRIRHLRAGGQLMNKEEAKTIKKLIPYK
jgi:large subunit ribosomal protein L35